VNSPPRNGGRQENTPEKVCIMTAANIGDVDPIGDGMLV
jgi:hypothetical protein